MSYHTFETYAEIIAGGRNKRDRPLANNTRAHYIDEDTIGIKLHATDVVIYHRDGRIQLNSGGYRTITTWDRIRSFSPARPYSDSGVVYVNLPPDADDPKPVYPHREVAKPFHAPDPGPEPVKSPEGCKVGAQETRTEQDEQFVRADELREGESFTRDSYSGGDDYGYVTRNIIVATVYVEHQHETWSHNNPPKVEAADKTEVVQCPHCKLFEAQHETWSEHYNGPRWGRDRDKGYRQMTEALARYGSREAWQEAYLADFRRVREERKEYKAWTERNRVLFTDMMEVDSDGYALLPDPEQSADHALMLAAMTVQKDRINRFVRLAMDKLKAGMPMPGPGDCWYCSMTQVPTGEPMGDAMPTLYEDGAVRVQPSYGHLDDHIDEEYVVPSMLVNAMREKGYADAGIAMLLDMDFDNNRMGGSPHGADYKSVGDALRRYLTSRLIPQANGSTGSSRATMRR